MTLTSIMPPTKPVAAFIAKYVPKEEPALQDWLVPNNFKAALELFTAESGKLDIDN